MPDDTKVDRLVRRVKDNRVLAIVIFATIILLGAGKLIESIDTMWSIVEKRAVRPTRESPDTTATKTEVASSTRGSHRLIGSSVLLPVDLNVLVFNASEYTQAHTRFVHDFINELPGLRVESSSQWAQRYEMESSLIFFQGKQNKKYALQLAEWFPGPQEAQDYQKDPDGFFGFSPERDIIIFVGNDWRDLIRVLER